MLPYQLSIKRLKQILVVEDMLHGQVVKLTSNLTRVLTAPNLLKILPFQGRSVLEIVVDELLGLELAYVLHHNLIHLLIVHSSRSGQMEL